MTTAVLYTKPTCPYCIRAISLLEKLGIEYTNYDVSNNDALRQEIIAKTNHKTVPVVFINDEYVGGFDSLHALYTQGKLV